MKHSPLFRYLRLWALSALLLFLAAGNALARADDMNDLRQKVDNLIATNQKNYQDVAQAMNDLIEVKQEFRSIKGQLDSSQYTRQESDRVYQDLDQRVSALEDKIGQIHNLLKDLNLKLSVPPSAAPGKISSAATSSKESEEFQNLLNVANARDYRNAAAGFQGFIKKYPKSEYAGSAQYWVADSFYSMGDYVKAISEFQALSERYPTNVRVKEGIYKQGLSFMKLNKTPEAKLFFQKVIATYPESPEAFQAKGRLLRLEDLEKTSPALALNPKDQTSPTPPPAPSPGATVYKPIMKPVPMPRAPLPQGPGTSPTAPKPQPAEPAPNKPTQDSSAPLF